MEMKDTIKSDDAAFVRVEKERAARKKKKKKVRIIIGLIIALVVLVITAIVIVGVVLSKKMLNTMIESTMVAYGPIKESVTMNGMVESEEQKIYYSGITALVGKVTYKQGDLVKKGDTIFTYDEEEMKKLQLEAKIQAEASGYEYQVNSENNEENKITLAAAENDIKKYKALVNQKEKEIETLENSLSSEVKTKKKELEDKVAQGNADIAGWEFNINSGLLSKEAILTFKGYINSKTLEISDWNKQIADLSEYTSTDGKEDQLKQARKDLATYQENLTKAEGKKTSAETGVLSDTQEKQLEANSELNQMRVEENVREVTNAAEGIKADLNGVITSMQLVDGQMVTQGQEMLVLQSLDKLKTSFSVNRNTITKLKIGQKVTFKILNHTYEGTVTRIDHMAQSVDNSSVICAEAHIDNPDENIIIGVDAKMEVQTASKDHVLLVPVLAVNTDVQGDFCYVVKDGIATKVYVKIGVSNYDYCEITEGLNEGDEVITRMLDYDLDGMPVTTSCVPMELELDDEQSK